MSVFDKFIKALIRRKDISAGKDETNLKRCLTTLDLTALGIGSTLGLGIYVIAGQVASEKSGPSVTLSFLIAAVASVFAGLCYAEFGARVPRAGSAYVYSYVTVGEFMAFVIGWNLILEYVIGTASVARGYSGYIDSLFNRTIEKSMRESMPISLQDVSPYPDFLALGITLFLTVLLAVGVKESSRFNTVFTGLNLLVVVFAVVAGALKANVHNWEIDKSELNETSNAGNGGFFPFGFTGMMEGAATCFYGFIGFDCIATTGEEVKNPQRSIPISIVLSLFFVFLAYFGVSAVQTLVVPYYMQDQPAPLPYVFDEVGWTWAGWIVRVGALTGLSTSLLGAMFPLPRVLYAMAKDGVIFRFFSNVHPRFKTPLIATAFAGGFSGIMAMMFNVRELADMMSIGTLLAYTLVAISVLILRYRPVPSTTATQNDQSVQNRQLENDSHETDKTRSPSSALLSSSTYMLRDLMKRLFNTDSERTPTKKSSRVSCFLICSAGVLMVILNGVLALAQHYSEGSNPLVISVMASLAAIILLMMVMISRQPTENVQLSFKVPLVPFIPFLSVFVNTYLMCKLSVLTWKRFAVWMYIGFCMYFLYGMWHSNERKNEKVLCLSTVQTDEHREDTFRCE